MKRVDYVTLDGIQKSAKFEHKWSAKKLSYHSLFLENLRYKLNAKYLIRIVDAS